MRPRAARCGARAWRAALVLAWLVDPATPVATGAARRIDDGVADAVAQGTYYTSAADDDEFDVFRTTPLGDAPPLAPLASPLRRSVHELAGDGQCPTELAIFSKFRCERLFNASKEAAAAASSGNVTMRITATSSDDCLSLSTTCNVTHAEYGSSVLLEEWDFHDPCEWAAVHRFEYEVRWGGAGGLQTTRASGSHRIALGEAVEIVDPTGLLPSEAGASPAHVYTLRLHMRDGMLNVTSAEDNSTISKQGFFARVEYVDQTEDAVAFVAWMHLSQTMQQRDCDPQSPRSPVSYKYYDDPDCKNFSSMVSGYDADGLCESTLQTTARQGTFKVYTAALCEDDSLYILQTFYRDMGFCHASTNTTWDLKRKALAIPLKQRGQCARLAWGSIILSADACTPAEERCHWTRGTLNGEKVLLAANVKSLDDCRANISRAQYLGACGLEWAEDDPEGNCYAVRGMCEGPLRTWYGGKEWSCLLHSTGGVTAKRENKSLTVALVGLGILTVLLLSVLMIAAAWKYKEMQNDLAAARSNVTVQLIDSGNTDGIVIGVPVPNERQMRADDDDACSDPGAIPFPLPSVGAAASGAGGAGPSSSTRGGPQLTSASAPGASTVAQGEVEVDDDVEEEVLVPYATAHGDPQPIGFVQTASFTPDDDVTTNPLNEFPRPRGSVGSTRNSASVATPSGEGDRDGGRSSDAVSPVESIGLSNGGGGEGITPCDGGSEVGAVDADVDADTSVDGGATGPDAESSLRRDTKSSASEEERRHGSAAVAASPPK